MIREGRRRRYRIDLQYDGTDFSGMQWQPDRRTVQQCLEEALEPLFEHPVRVIPSSRTDAGVHAAQQVVHVDVNVERPTHSIVRAGNSLLPPDIRLLSAVEVDADFHARFSARWRGYVYRISLEPIALGRQYTWQFVQPIEAKRLHAQAGTILGTHSFAAFSHESPTEKHDYGCTVYRSEWVQENLQWSYRIEASRFVHGMVRMLVGTMVDIACGRGRATSLRDVLETQDNRFAGTKAPPCGLTLNAVGYRDWPGI
ncbi:MAG: tRNA pseudouridine(38-40) synthase TruA [bacterium]|nr:tRNA pseudouridine(38-40) synthase TruA [bacterium]